MSNKLSLLIILCLISACSFFRPKPPKKIMWKEKVYHSGRDILKIKKAKRSHLDVEIQSANPINGDTCELEASFSPIIVDSEYQWQDSESSCLIKMKFAPKQVLFSYAHDCQAFCGIRAEFPESFKVSSEVCDRKNVKLRRKKIKSLMSKRAYKEAADAYGGILVKCEDFMDLTERYSLINDRALALWKSGDPGNCRDTLEPISHWAGRDDEVGQSELPHISELRKDINYTWKLCHLSK